MSGHSKWAQIKHKKAATDQKKGALFSKIASEITVAARSGGQDPVLNSRLRATIERARASGLPKDNIERALARARANAGADSLHEFLYEALGPGGAQILIEGITDNSNRSHAEVRKILADRGAKFVDPGSVSWNFEKRGYFRINELENPGKTQGEIELILIDSGVEDYEKDDGALGVRVIAEETERARGALMASGIASQEAHYGYHAKNRVALSKEARESLALLFKELSDHADIHNVYTNTDL